MKKVRNESHLIMKKVRNESHLILMIQRQYIKKVKIDKC
jgi:hypothetical protein